MNSLTGLITSLKITSQRNVFLRPSVHKRVKYDFTWIYFIQYCFMPLCLILTWPSFMHRRTPNICWSNLGSTRFLVWLRKCMILFKTSWFYFQPWPTHHHQLQHHLHQDGHYCHYECHSPSYVRRLHNFHSSFPHSIPQRFRSTEFKLPVVSFFVKAWITYSEARLDAVISVCKYIRLSIFLCVRKCKNRLCSTNHLQ